MEFPKILIVKIEGLKYSKFNLKHNAILIINNEITYSLKGFLNGKNNIYFKKRIFWYKYNEKNMKKFKIMKKRLQVFYFMN